jgi:hypothetical protein
MNKWGPIIAKLQENMVTLMEKVNSMQSNLEDMRKTMGPGSAIRREDTFKGTGLSHNQDTNTSMGHSSPLDHPVVNEYMEAIKARLSGFLESLTAQNEAILEENRRLRQHIGNPNSQFANGIEETFAYTHSNNHTKQNESIKNYLDSPNLINKSPSKETFSKDLEKTVSSLFEKNWKSWETILANQVRAQTELVEERLSKKLMATVAL